MLIGRTETLSQPAVSELISLLKGPEFARMIKPLPGYALDDPGEVVTLDDVFPWLARSRGRPYRFGTPKRSGGGSACHRREVTYRASVTHDLSIREVTTGHRIQGHSAVAVPLHPREVRKTSVPRAVRGAPWARRNHSAPPATE
jgi:hypothetical protein